MTRPLTPREKVARALSPKCWEFYDRHVDDPRMAAEIKHEVAPTLQAADTVLTALASGSGDHAELARAMERAKENAMALALTERAEFAEAELQRSTANMCEQFNRAEALLAENAALRTAVEIRDGHINRLIDRATEAERKLAEAEARLDRWEPKPFCPPSVSSSISKEAERG